MFCFYENLGTSINLVDKNFEHKCYELNQLSRNAELSVSGIMVTIKYLSMSDLVLLYIISPIMKHIRKVKIHRV